MVAHRPMPLTLMTHAQLRRLAGDLHRHRVAIQHRMAKIDEAIGDVQREISKRDQIEVEVSDHAAVRWLERQKGMDIQAVRNEIANNARGLRPTPAPRKRPRATPAAISRSTSSSPSLPPRVTNRRSRAVRDLPLTDADPLFDRAFVDGARVILCLVVSASAGIVVLGLIALAIARALG